MVVGCVYDTWIFLLKYMCVGFILMYFMPVHLHATCYLYCVALPTFHSLPTHSRYMTTKLHNIKELDKRDVLWFEYLETITSTERQYDHYIIWCLRSLIRSCKTIACLLSNLSAVCCVNKEVLRQFVIGEHFSGCRNLAIFDITLGLVNIIEYFP